ncbi:hypothetical protein [Paraburkholderia sp. C35]|uniref:hypothetical protein n=1 Tax=Paraburkholderia sp. C35 TaxID=2126993 RepID=UPI000D69806D|nr:hypothetical protein [Paraburkholderia sp. C35]
MDTYKDVMSDMGFGDDVPEPPEPSPAVEIDVPTPAPVPPVAAPAIASSGRPSVFQRLLDTHATLVEASNVVFSLLEDKEGVVPLLDGINFTLGDALKVLVATAFREPTASVQHTLAKSIQDASKELGLFAAMRSGKAFKDDKLDIFNTSFKAMDAAHEAWGKARSQASRVLRSSQSADVRKAMLPPDLFVKTRDAAEALAERIKVLEAETKALGEFGGVYERAIQAGDVVPLQQWRTTYKPMIDRLMLTGSPLPATAPAAAVALAPVAAPVTGDAAPNDQPDEPEEVVILKPTRRVPRSDDAVPVPVPSAPAAPQVDVVREEERKVVRVDLSTGEILSDDDRAHEVAQEEMPSLPAVESLVEDHDPMEEQVAPEPLDRSTRVTHATDDVAPRHAGTPSGGPLEFAQKHFIALGAGAAVLVLGVAFWFGHQSRAPAVPVAAPVAAPAAVPTPVTTVPPVVAPPTTAPAAPVVASTPVLPAPAPAKPEEVTPKPVAAKPVPEVRKPAHPVAREHVTTMRETNQALDRLRQKLGE